jgi:serine/threonine-protein kinase
VTAQLERTIPSFDDAYVLDSVLGQSGQVARCKMWSQQQRRWVVARYLCGPAALDEQAQEEFLADYEHVEGLTHPVLLQVLKVERVDSVVIGIEEFVEGTRFDRWLDANTSMELSERMRIAIQLVRAVCCLHEHDHLHLGLSEHAFVVQADRSLRLVDFGRHAFIHEERHSSLSEEERRNASPEELAGQLPSMQSDVFQVGALLFLLLSGRRARLSPAAPIPSLVELEPSLPMGLGQLVDRCLSDNPEHRPSSVASLLKGLQEQFLQLRTLKQTRSSGSFAAVRSPARGVPRLS